MKLPTIGWDDIGFACAILAVLVISLGWLFTLYAAVHFIIKFW